MESIRTARLEIRSLEEADIGGFADVVRSAFTSSSGPPSTEEAEHLYWASIGDRVQARLGQPPFGERAIVRCQDGVLIGLVGFVPSLVPVSFPETTVCYRYRLEVGLFWALHEQHRGRGYATEAAMAFVERGFRRMRLARIVAATERDNLASLAVIDRLGMVRWNAPPEAPPWLQVVGWIDAPT